MNLGLALDLKFALYFRLNDCFICLIYWLIWKTFVLHVLEPVGDIFFEATNLVKLKVISNDPLASVLRIRDNRMLARSAVVLELFGLECRSCIAPK